MSYRPPRQFRRLIVHNTRMLGTALLVASLLLGLIPPPLVTTLVPAAAPIAALLPAPSVARAASFTYPITGGDTIPDNACGTSDVVKTVNVTDNFTITDLNVGVKIAHTSRAHMVISITSPDNTTVLLHQKALTTPHDGMDATFDQSAATEASSDTSIHDTAAPDYDVQWNPNGDLDVFNGKNSVGTWTLTICDQASTTTGTFNQAELFFEGTSAEPGTVTGVVFEDLNNDGVHDSNEPGLADVTVQAIDASGNSLTTTTNSAGSFVFVYDGAMAGTDIRLEFAPAASSNYQPGPQGIDSASSVQFASVPSGGTI